MMRYVMPVTILASGFFFASSQRNNVCKRALGYYLWYSLPDCSYDSDVDSDVTTLIRRYGYDYATYHLTSRDGYISALFRIRNKSKTQQRTPVLLVHAALFTSATYILNKNNSLGSASIFAFVLADAGFDVWLVDIRGTQNSVGHVTLSTEDNEYWDYTLDDIIENDVGLYLDLIIKESTHDRIIYVGHAIGSSMLMGYSSNNPEKANKLIKLAVFMSPSAEINHTKTVLLKETLGRYGTEIWDFLYNLRIAKYVSADRYQQSGTRFLESLLGIPGFFVPLTNYFGRNTEIPLYLAPAFFKHVLRGLSLKTFIQLYQASVGPFGKYDYRSAGNLERYGTETPPVYNVTKMEFPVYLVYAPDDAYATVTDSELLYEKLSPSAKRYGKYEVPHKGFNHFGYALAESAKSLLYDRLVRLFHEIEAEEREEELNC